MERLGYVKKSASPVMTLQRILGFRNTRTLLLWILFGSVVTRFALARISGIDIDGVLCAQRGRSVPGECFFWQGEEMLAKASMVLHIGSILPASVLAILQFVPYLRKGPLRFHRVTGYLTLLLSGIGVSSGLVVTRNAFGGTLELQSAMILSSIMFLACLCLAVYYVKRLDIEKHRAWMLRAWAVAFHVITMRFLNTLIPIFLPDIYNKHFIVRSCAVVDHMFGSNATIVEALYPACEAFYSGVETEIYVMIRGNSKPTRPDHVAANFGITCATSAWVALLLHCVLAEVYLAWTTTEAERLRRVSYEGRLADKMSTYSVNHLSVRPDESVSWDLKIEKESCVASDSESSSL